MARRVCKRGNPDAARSVRASELPATNVADPLCSATHELFFRPFGAELIGYCGRRHLLFHLRNNNGYLLGKELFFVGELKQEGNG